MNDTSPTTNPTAGARETMLATIRAAVRSGTPSITGKHTGADADERAYQHTGTHQPGSTPVIDLLIDRLLDYRATVRTTTAANLETAVRQALSTSASVVIPAGIDPNIRAACAQDNRTVHIDGQPTALSADQLDSIDTVVTGARVAIALTGTIILDSSPDQGRRALTLIPDRHLIILHTHQIVETVPEGIAHLNPTAPLTLISGPSATSDIELERVEGVHGPRHLDVLIIDPG